MHMNINCSVGEPNDYTCCQCCLCWWHCRPDAFRKGGDTHQSMQAIKEARKPRDWILSNVQAEDVTINIASLIVQSLIKSTCFCKARLQMYKTGAQLSTNIQLHSACKVQAMHWKKKIHAVCKYKPVSRRNKYWIEKWQEQSNRLRDESTGKVLVWVNRPSSRKNGMQSARGKSKIFGSRTSKAQANIANAWSKIAVVVYKQMQLHVHNVDENAASKLHICYQNCLWLGLRSQDKQKLSSKVGWTLDKTF